MFPNFITFTYLHESHFLKFKFVHTYIYRKQIQIRAFIYLQIHEKVLHKLSSLKITVIHDDKWKAKLMLNYIPGLGYFNTSVSKE
jgi:hypothetical protein